MQTFFVPVDIVEQRNENIFKVDVFSYFSTKSKSLHCAIFDIFLLLTEFLSSKDVPLLQKMLSFCSKSLELSESIALMRNDANERSKSAQLTLMLRWRDDDVNSENSKKVSQFNSIRLRACVDTHSHRYYYYFFSNNSLTHAGIKWCRCALNIKYGWCGRQNAKSFNLFMYRQWMMLNAKYLRVLT